MKRILSILMLAALLLSLAACGATGNQSTEPATDASGAQLLGNFAIPEGGYDGSEVTIKFGHTMGIASQEILDYYIGEFNKLYPNITVEHSAYGGWGDIAGLINTEIMGDNQPNIVYCYPDHVAMYNMSHSTVILDDLINSKIEVTRDDGTTETLGYTEEQLNDFVESFYAEGAKFGDGLMYTLPLSKSIEVLYYNKTFFEANGLTVPTTWDEMKALCKKILEIDPNCIPLGYDSEDNLFITMCEQYGYDYTSASGDEHYLFNNDNCKAFVKELRDWYQAGYITTQSLYGSYTSGLFVETTDNHSYMCIGSSGGARHQLSNKDTSDGSFAFDVGIAPIPQVNKDNQKVISQGPSVCILKGGKTTDQQVLASWLFVKFLTTDMGFQTEFASDSGYVPVIKSAQSYEPYAAWLQKANGHEYLQALVNTVVPTQAEYYFTSPAFNGSSVARKQVGALLTKCMSEETDDLDSLINNAFQEAYEECVFLGG